MVLNIPFFLGSIMGNEKITYWGRIVKIFAHKKQPFWLDEAIFDDFFYQRINIPTSRHMFFSQWFSSHELHNMMIRHPSWHTGDGRNTALPDMYETLYNGINYISNGAEFVPSWYISWAQTIFHVYDMCNFLSTFWLRSSGGGQQKKLVPCTTNFSFITI